MPIYGNIIFQKGASLWRQWLHNILSDRKIRNLKELQDLSHYVILNRGQYRWLFNLMVKVTLAAWSDRLLCTDHLLYQRSPLYELKEKGPQIKKKQKTEKSISQNASHRHHCLLHLPHCGQPPSQNSKVNFHLPMQAFLFFLLDTSPIILPCFVRHWNLLLLLTLI